MGTNTTSFFSGIQAQISTSPTTRVGLPWNSNDKNYWKATNVTLVQGISGDFYISSKTNQIKFFVANLDYVKVIGWLGIKEADIPSALKGFLKSSIIPQKLVINLGAGLVAKTFTVPNF